MKWGYCNSILHSGIEIRVFKFYFFKSRLHNNPDISSNSFSGFNFELGTISVPFTDSKTLAKSSMFGTLNPLDTFAFNATCSDVFLTISAVALYLKLFFSIFENGNAKKELSVLVLFRAVLPTRAPKFHNVLSHILSF